MVDKDRTIALVCAAQEGDYLAFSELVRTNQDIAVAYATSLLGDHQLAEDAAQEAFVDAYKQLASLREPAAFHAWFRTVIFKQCDRMMRRKQHRMIGLEDALEVPSREPSPLDNLESSARAASIREAIAGLTDAEHAVVLLYYMGEHSHSIIAKLLDVTTNVVKTRLYSARLRLRDHLNEIEQGLRAARPSNDPRFTRRVMAAALPLQLYLLDAHNSKQPNGSTVGRRTAQIPESDTWLIEPRSTLSRREWDTVISLLGEMKIPGFGASGQATDDLLERISRLEHLTYLDLHDCPEVSDEGLKYLVRLPRLRHLNLSCPTITDHGLEILHSLPELRTFELTHRSRITDDGLRNLVHCDRLERVNVMGTPSGDGVVQALAGKRRLSHLFLGTGLTDRGIALLRDLPVFKTWHGGKAVMSLMSFQADPNYLWLNLKAPLTDRGMANLDVLEGLYALNLFGGSGDGPFDARASAVTPSGLRPLAGLPNLEWLGCNANLCTDEAMREIGAMPRLRFLMCQDAVAGDKGFMAIGRSQSIEYIWGRRCYNLTGPGFSSMAAMPSLRGLSVTCRNVDDRGLSALPRFPVLKEFMPMDVKDQGFHYVGCCYGLEALLCMYCEDTSDVATEQIAGLSKLKSYKAWRNQITNRSLEILGRMESLEHLHFYKCDGITGAGLPLIARLPKLREVNLDGLRNIPVDAAALFPAEVRVNYSA